MSSINYKAAPVAAKFHGSEAFIRGIMGPIGSGKSVACCIEMFRISSQVQEPGPDGIRKTRWLVVRNTLPQLETTTIKTWCDWFPPKTFGKMTGKPPYTHFVRYGDVDMEVIFIALDKPEDVKKLLSFECTGIWFNEAREINKELIDAATGRVGRYPSAKDGGCTWSGIIMDTNPPDDSHWWYQFAEEGEWCRDKEGRLRDPQDVPPTERWEFFKQPSGLDLEKAENLENHMQPKNREALSLEERRKLGLRYYERMIPGKTPEWVNVYVHGNYGFIQDGKPVYKSSWNDEVHTAKEEIQIPPSAPLIAGVDCSGRNPAVVWLWKSPLGSYKVIDELICQDIGAVAFSKLLASEQKRRFPMNETVFYGDPAGSFKAMTDERTYVDILRAEGINVYPAPTNNVTDRTQSVEGALLRLTGEGPAFQVDKKCKILRRGFNGGYKYRKLNVSGEARYDPKPEKNRFSDVQDALQYAMLGAGEGRAIRGFNGRKQRKTPVAKSDFKVF